MTIDTTDFWNEERIDRMTRKRLLEVIEVIGPANRSLRDNLVKALVKQRELEADIARLEYEASSAGMIARVRKTLGL